LLPAELNRKIRDRARRERQSFTQQTVVLLETALDRRAPIDPDVDEDEVERLADLARETLGQERRPPPPK